MHMILKKIPICLINLCNKLGFMFVKVAYILSPGKDNPVYNLILRYNNEYLLNKIMEPTPKQSKHTEVIAVKFWCEQKNLLYKVVNPEQQTLITEPRIINPPSPITHIKSGYVTLPPTYIAETVDTTIFAGSSIILTNQDTVTLSDEIATDDSHLYDFKTPFIKSINGSLKIDYLQKYKIPLKEAIHFCGDYSYNYYHWVIECLPRLSIIDKFPEYDTIPLLIDEGLFPQQLDALDILNKKKRQLITLKTGCLYEIDKLIIPSMLTVIRDNSRSPVAFDKDVLITPQAIHYVRNNIFNRLGLNPSHGFRKLFITRKKPKYRRLLNIEKIEELMITLGFEIVFAESLSFINQVQLFSQAEIVVGPSGAGLTNIIFCPQNCNVFVLINHHLQTNYYLFSNLAQIVNINIQFIPGIDVIKDIDQNINNDFIVEEDMLCHIINQHIMHKK